MKRRRPSTDSRPPPSNPWRWAIGGPITEFGEDGIDAGPSGARDAGCAAAAVAAVSSSSSSVVAADTRAACLECTPGIAHLDAPPGVSASAPRSGSRVSSTSAYWLPLQSLSEPPPLQQPGQPPDHPAHLSDEFSLQPQPPPLAHYPPVLHPRRRRLPTAHALTAALALATAFTPLAAAGPLPSVTPATRALSSATFPTATPTLPTPTPTPTLARRRLEPDPDYQLPSSLPTIPTTTLPATVLPYYLTQLDDGHWYTVDNAWWLYHRVVEPRSDPAPATSSPVSYAAISVLPRGWGVSTERTALYQTPLIVAAAVILAVCIVTGIIFITIQRRKMVRRKKRHDARMRRKALAAAGMTEEDVKNAGEETERAFKDRIDEFERQYQLKQRIKGKTHKSAFVRTKVRVWHKGLRKRKGGGVTSLARNKTDETGFTSAHGLGVNRPQSVASSFTASESSIASSRSSRSESRRRSNGSDNRRMVATPAQDRTDVSSSDQAPETTLVNSDSHSSPTSYTSNTRSLSHPQSSSHDPMSLHSNPQSSPQSHAQSSSSSSEEPTHYLHLPPAYRPASVHSSDRGEGSSAGPSSGMRNAAVAAEKVAASGFYPAPATAEAEQAQAVAHRADAKAPIVIPPPEEERRERHHIATDDKRELERLRLGGSAPPVVRQDDSEGAGPSAPHFDVDDTGFEVLPEGLSSRPLSRLPTETPAVATPGIPLPPTPIRLKSLRTVGLGGDGSGSEPMIGSAPPRSRIEAPMMAPSAPPLHGDNVPLPSAPPLPPVDSDIGPSSAPSAPPAPPFHADSGPSAPSAPPHDSDSDDNQSVSGDGSSASAASYTFPTPSAPPLDEHDDSDSDGHEHEHRLSRHLHEHRTRTSGAATPTCPDSAGASDTDASDMRANLGVNGHRFLPRYEP